ncbi:DUF2336 domain-containing protein [Devosia pacifica]|nr:DUF2336 domain-containing protein [Devosia pacifica]
MIGYDEFFELSQSADSEKRGIAAHLAATAYLRHDGPADEHAALYAALFGFLEDRSVKVRAALAYGLLHAEEAPRALMLALLHDSSIISRAVLQYSPVLLDADMLSLLPGLELEGLLAIAHRERLSERLAARLLALKQRPLTLHIVQRLDVPLGSESQTATVAHFAEDAQIRGALLARPDLVPSLRLQLVERVGEALRDLRVVKGSVAPDRLNRMLRNAVDAAVATIGDLPNTDARGLSYAASMIEQDRISTRVLLHALVHGQVLFFANCCAELSGTPSGKVFALLETGSRAALNALFSRCSLSPAVRNILARLIAHARQVDLSDDLAARHYIVTALTEELIAEHDGDIPENLSEAFAYLSEQNAVLARQAAKGVMMAFASQTDAGLGGQIECHSQAGRLALPAA